jgi:hypothetical protein
MQRGVTKILVLSLSILSILLFSSSKSTVTDSCA